MIGFLLAAQLLQTSVDTGQVKVRVFLDNVARDSVAVAVAPIPIIRSFYGTLLREISNVPRDCSFFMYSDSSLVLPTHYQSDSTCARYYSTFPVGTLKNSGYYQKRVDQLCHLTGREPECNFDRSLTLFHNSPWPPPDCTPTTEDCALTTIIVDFDRQSEDLYGLDSAYKANWCPDPSTCWRLPADVYRHDGGWIMWPGKDYAFRTGGLNYYFFVRRP